MAMVFFTHVWNLWGSSGPQLSICLLTMTASAKHTRPHKPKMRRLLGLETLSKTTLGPLGRILEVLAGYRSLQ